MNDFVFDWEIKDSINNLMNESNSDSKNDSSLVQGWTFNLIILLCNHLSKSENAKTQHKTINLIIH